ncbi:MULTISPECIES: hypothetical protein [Arthrobacter]|uniref:hypothetical protein n=1 Tax=Arthrobacter TaxID=1663 RepID=UPI0006D98CC6|nr:MULTISPECIES: hypothetical protein [unclassified Arthrobacter]KPN18159.1 hypothetical protein AO716_09730 [Arthrobacter sp. Edens01]MSR98940.1 hypothetical protein [Arthrobacter sp. BL-252-APC-1A]
MATVVPDPGSGQEPRLPEDEIPEPSQIELPDYAVEIDSEGHHYGVDREYINGKPHREPAEPVVYPDYMHSPLFREHLY